MNYHLTVVPERREVYVDGRLHLFLGTFAKLRKATISFVMSVCLSVRMEQLCSHWMDFHEI
jgi:hypothetical protein